jgi:hypothetical protein
MGEREIKKEREREKERQREIKCSRLPGNKLHSIS